MWPIVLITASDYTRYRFPGSSVQVLTRWVGSQEYAFKPTPSGANLTIMEGWEPLLVSMQKVKQHDSLATPCSHRAETRISFFVFIFFGYRFGAFFISLNICTFGRCVCV